MAKTIFYHFPIYPYEHANEQLKRQVWQKAVVIDDVNPDLVRADPFGFAICYNEHGNRNSDMGWEMVRLTKQGEPQQEAVLRAADKDSALPDEDEEFGETDAVKLFPVHWRMNHRERQN